MSANAGSQLLSKDELIKQLTEQVAHWRNKYEALAKLYTQLRGEHLDMLGKFKQFQLKANSAQEAIDKMERMERDMKAKNLELADMIRERDRARFDVDRLKSVSWDFWKVGLKKSTDQELREQSQKDEVERLRRDLRFAQERAEDATRNKSQEVSGLLGKYDRQLNELENSLRVRSTEQLQCLGKRLTCTLLLLSPSKSKLTICCAKLTTMLMRLRGSKKRRTRRLRLPKRA